MWLFLSDAFLSIVTDRENPDQMLVRARVAGDIERVFPDANITATPERDYQFRTWLPRRQVAATIARQVQEISYTSFKGSVHDSARHHIYYSVYSAALRLNQMLKHRSDRQINMFP